MIRNLLCDIGDPWDEKHVSDRMYLEEIKKPILTIILFGTSSCYVEKYMHVYMNNFS